MGTNYAALVLDAAPDAFRVLLYSFAAQTLRGRIRLWALAHGRYRLTLGPDANGDDRADRIARDERLEVLRATAVPLALPPGQVMVLELRQEQRLDDELARSDLALSPRETKVRGGTVAGVAHNIGAAGAPACVVALVNPAGKLVAKQSLGALPAPRDLVPVRRPFRLPGLPRGARGWHVALDPTGALAEVYEGNNRVPVPGSHLRAEQQ